MDDCCDDVDSHGWMRAQCYLDTHSEAPFQQPSWRNRITMIRARRSYLKPRWNLRIGPWPNVNASADDPSRVRDDWLEILEFSRGRHVDRY